MPGSPPPSPAVHPITPPEGAGGKYTVKVGICAMEKKTCGKPMKQILTRLQAFVARTCPVRPSLPACHTSRIRLTRGGFLRGAGTASGEQRPEFEFIIWKDEMTLHEPVENWPQCDCLLSWLIHLT